jgi:hypothetical protein
MFMRIDSKLFSLSHRSQSRRGDERAGVRVPGLPLAELNAISAYLYTLQIQS